MTALPPLSVGTLIVYSSGSKSWVSFLNVIRPSSPSLVLFSLEPVQNKGSNSPRDEDGNSVSESPDHEGFLPAAGFGGISLALQRKTDVELDTGSSGHLRKPVSLVHDRHGLLDVRLRLQGRMQWGVVDRGSKLTVRQDIGISTNWGLIVSDNP